MKNTRKEILRLLKDTRWKRKGGKWIPSKRKSVPIKEIEQKLKKKNLTKQIRQLLMEGEIYEPRPSELAFLGA